MIFARIATLFVFSGSALFLPGMAREDNYRQAPQILGTSIDQKIGIKPTPEFLNIQAVPQLSAKAAMAYDLHTGAILYISNFDEKLPIASLTKLMTALVVYDNIDLNKVITVQKDDTRTVGNNMGLLPGEQILAGEVLKGMLISSCNDATQVLATATAGSQQRFVALMNAKARALGLNSTNFTNPVGLDIDENYSTAYDLSKLVDEFVKNPTLSDIVKTKDIVLQSVDGNFSHRLRSTNKLLLEDDNVTGIKTGFTDIAKGSLILRVRVKQGPAEIITIILGSDSREDDSKKLVNWISNVYNWQ